jgi:hypothetical protein
MSDSNLYTEILKFEAMNDTQLANLKSNYVEMIIDGMDMKTMETLVYDMLIESYELYSEDDMKDEIVDSYGEEILEDLMS